MWSQITLCLLVGLAYASNPAWKDNKEYVYQVRGRTLSSLHELSDKFTGILMKATLKVRPMSENELYATITESQYTEIDSNLPDGWDQQILDQDISYKPLPLSRQPFRVIMEKGAITDLKVSKEISNWEANMIKSIVSQIQLDTQAKNLIPSHINTPNFQESNSAVFKTMEETVTGLSETLYEIHPLPDQQIQDQPELVPLEHLRGNGNNIEVLKTKNYTNSEQRPAYHFGFDGVDRFEPNNNKIGQFYNRATFTRAVLTGDGSRFTIQSSVTVDKILISPTWTDKQQGSVNTMLNLTLVDYRSSTESVQSVPNPVSVGLLYKYDHPYATSNQARPRRFENENPSNRASSEAVDESVESNDLFSRNKRFSREFDNIVPSRGFSSGESSEEQHTHNQAPLRGPPESPLLPFTVGYEGRSIKQDINVVEQSKKLALQIGQEMEHPNQIPQKNTIGKFVQLTSVLRTMSSEEMQQVASQLYTKNQKGAEANAWAAFRDAVAQSGTGPSLVSIKDWITSDKIRERDAADVVAVLAQSTRQPTQEYMSAFLELVKTAIDQEHRHLNESALLAYTKLVHQVYVNDKVSHSRFPVHSFGPFRTSPFAENLVKKEVIPYLTEKLQQAVKQGDTQKIHAYVRALGNVGHRKILEAFEPYLEGKTQTSQFQRVLMVIALDKLATSNPRIARSVLYKIYQNPADYEQVRVAAVFQLMRTSPSAEMLQRMAENSKQETSEYVNSAVHSSINSAAQLQGAEHDQLRKAAIAAQPFLPNVNYGEQYSQNHLRSYVDEEMQLAYKQTYQHFGSPDSIVPRGISHKLRARFAGSKVNLWTMHALVSSFDDLLEVMSQQTKENNDESRLKANNRNVQQGYSPENIANILKMDLEQREQLESFLYLQMGPLQKMLSLDNDTIEMMPQLLKQLEEQLKNGIYLQERKMFIADEYALSFPTALGLPFLYTFDKPILISTHAKLRASAQPQLSSGTYLQKPEKVNADWDVSIVVSARSQSQLGFITPFSHQRYSAGYDKNFHVQIPLTGKVQYDVQKNQVTLEIQRLQESGTNPNLIHFSTWPYTCKDNIYSQDNKKFIIQKKNPQEINTVVGDKSTGIAFGVQLRSDKHMDVAWVIEKLQNHDPISALLAPWVDEEMQHTEINVNLNSEESTTDKVIVQIGYQHIYQPRKLDDSSRNMYSHDISTFENIPNEPSKRQKEFMKRASADIDSAHARVYDFSVEFKGQQNIQYVLTASNAKSNVGTKSRFLGQLLRIGNQIRPTKFFWSAEGKVPNTNGLNAAVAMDLNPKVRVSFTASLGESYLRSTKFKGDLTLDRSESRKDYLKEQRVYKECQRESRKGNQQLSACAYVTAHANILDQFDFQVRYENMNPLIENATFKAYSWLRHNLYPRVEEDVLSAGHGENRLSIEGQFSPDFESANVTVALKQARVQVHKTPVSQWARSILAQHPVFHVRSRVFGQLYNYPAFRPFCVVDQTAANTFDNKTYPVSMNTEWTVLLQFAPKRPARSQDQVHGQRPAFQPIADQIETYSILSRASPQSSNNKEVKIIIQTPHTEQKLIEIEMKSSTQQPRVTINGQDISYNQNQQHDMYQGKVQVYGLPNAEVKLEVYEAFYVIFDGERVKVTIVDNKFRDSVRGLCGTFDGETQTDFTDPNNCILRDPQEFVNSYSMSGTRQPKERNNKGTGSERCYERTVKYVDVISSADIGVSKYEPIYLLRSSARSTARSSCTKLQTQYVEDGDQICFTTRPQPACKPGCVQKGQIAKGVSVHCVQATSATDLWKSQIDKGNSPDFSSKQKTKTMSMGLPETCSQQ